MSRQPLTRHRVLYIGPMGAALAALCASLPMLAALAISRSPDSLATHFAGGMAAAAVAGVVGAWAFNMIAPIAGGVRLWLGPDPTDATSESAARWKACPTCAERIRADRSFCPSCGADLASEEE